MTTILKLSTIWHPVKFLGNKRSPILGAVAKLRKAIISFVMPVRLSFFLSVCLSVRPHETTRLPLEEFS
jgi:hypothetical protein